MAHISPDFTIDDIHQIREESYELTKNMTIEEKLKYYNTPITDADEMIEKMRAKRKHQVLKK